MLNENVPCELAPIEDLLGMVPEERKLLADIQYLQLWLAEPDILQRELCSLVDMRLKRLIGSHVDPEVPYHPITLALFQYAALGQLGLHFYPDLYAVNDSAREISDATSMVSHWNPVKSSHKTSSPHWMTPMAFTAISWV